MPNHRPILRRAATARPFEVPTAAQLNQYPDTAAECIDDTVKYRRGVIPALKRFKAKRTGRYGRKSTERWAAMRTLVAELSVIYDRPLPCMKHFPDSGQNNGAYLRVEHTIFMYGELSIITLLHEFAHSLGKGERGAVKWSLNLFKRVFPGPFERLFARNANGTARHTLRRR